MMVAHERLGRVEGWPPLWRCLRTIQELDGLRTVTDWEAGGCWPPAAGDWLVSTEDERIISALPFVLLLCRFSLVPGLHPDWMLMLFFAHTHLTVTVTLCLLLVPKVTSSDVSESLEDFVTFQSRLCIWNKYLCLSASRFGVILIHNELFY